MRKISVVMILLMMLSMSAWAQEANLTMIEIEMSAEAAAMISNLGDEMGSKYFRQDAFEEVMRPSYADREAFSEMPLTADGEQPVFSVPMTETMYGRNHVYTFIPEGYERVILYIHGGAYVHNAVLQHAQTCEQLAMELNAKVYMPMYTLAPQGTVEEGYALMWSIWSDIIAEGKPVILMGDSAGGGFALGFAEDLAETDAPMPEKIILFSPWVDVTMANPDIADYEAVDVSLSVYGLVECGKMWAADADLSDRQVSPINYDHWEKLPDTMLFVGTAEIFYPDVTKLAECMRDAGTDVTLVCGTGLFHVFPIYTSIPESSEAHALIKAFIETPA